MLEHLWEQPELVLTFQKALWQGRRLQERQGRLR